MPTQGNKYCRFFGIFGSLISPNHTSTMSDRQEPHSSASLLASSLGAPIADIQSHLSSGHTGCCNELNDKDDYTQLGIHFRLMTPEARRRLFGSIAHNMAKVPHETRLDIICHLFHADPNYGIGVARALGIALHSETSFSISLPAPATA